MTAAVSPADALWPSVAVKGDLSRARREWLHTNGAGAYAASTLANMHTRRYHGLLVAALEPPIGRHVLLSHVDITVVAPREPGAPTGRGAPPNRWDLFKHQFPGVDPTAGALFLERFDQDPLPRWTYQIPAGELEVTLGLVRGENAVVLRYRFRGKKPVKLVLRPLIAARGHHQLQREHGGMMQRVELRALGEDAGPRGAGEVRVQPRKDLPRICFRYEGTFVGSPDWWRRFELLSERERGLDYVEDLWTPGVFEIQLGEEPATLLAAVDRLPPGDPEALLAASEAAIRAEDPGPGVPLLERRLHVAAEAFRADLAPRPAIIAGYPWFDIAGRDTLLALPGLYLVPRKIEGAKQILRDLMASMVDGLIPNRLREPTTGADDVSADTTLWFFEAARLLADAIGDGDPFVTGELYPALRAAFEAALRGTRQGIHVTADGLFAAGPSSEPLTWMLGRAAGAPAGAGPGCPVELCALWSRGCDTLARVARAASDEALAARAEAERDRARAAFRARFWCEETGYPYDVISEVADGPGAFHDPTLRPNALIALAVDPACFTAEQAVELLDRAQALVTRAGLRSLPPGDARYRGRYAGKAEERDAAYHRGAVWPWMMGFFVRAACQSAARAQLAPLLHKLVASAASNELAVGQVAELSDGDPPHAPAGCVAHALSVAELLRAVAWDLR
ncbi:MAG: amylo-alpha-1,6-glucosidase [Byssovorax sp.]